MAPITRRQNVKREETYRQTRYFLRSNGPAPLLELPVRSRRPRQSRPQRLTIGRVSARTPEPLTTLPPAIPDVTQSSAENDVSGLFSPGNAGWRVADPLPIPQSAQSIPQTDPTQGSTEAGPSVPQRHPPANPYPFPIVGDGTQNETENDPSSGSSRVSPPPAEPDVEIDIGSDLDLDKPSSDPELERSRLDLIATREAVIRRINERSGGADKLQRKHKGTHHNKKTTSRAAGNLKRSVFKLKGTRQEARALGIAMGLSHRNLDQEMVEADRTSTDDSEDSAMQLGKAIALSLTTGTELQNTASDNDSSPPVQGEDESSDDKVDSEESPEADDETNEEENAGTSTH